MVVNPEYSGVFMPHTILKAFDILVSLFMDPLHVSVTIDYH